MVDKAGFPYAAMRFDAKGVLHGAEGDLVRRGVTDVVVLAHGWKNDAEDAEALYEGILAGLRRSGGSELERGGRSWATIGVHWPAFRFKDDLSLLESLPGLAGGAAAVGADDVPRDELRIRARELGEELGAADPDAFADAAVAAAGGGLSADGFADELRGLVSDAPDGDVLREHASLLGERGRDLHRELKPGGDVQVAAPGDAASEGVEATAGLKDVARRLRSLRTGGAASIARILNQATYFEMKARAGTVGKALARELGHRFPEGVRLHLVGHSFGGRLVTAAAADDAMPAVESLSLLQAAYSHNGLGTGFGDGGGVVGAFRGLVEGRRVAGPIMVTHTLNDQAVGVAYALASAVSGVIASGFGVNSLIGGPGDPHGGMGANGAQSMRDGETIGHRASKGGAPALRRGVVNNVLADEIVTGHNDVANEWVGALVWAAASAR